MKLSPIAYFGIAAICQTAGSSGAAMLAPFFMKEHGYSIALVGTDVSPMGPAELAKFIQSEVANWARLVKLAGIQPE